MKRILITTMIAGPLGLGLGFVLATLGGERTTTSRLSPDETLRASLVERNVRGIDRHFQIRLENLTDQTTRTIFHSPDEGTPEGTERLIWSKDGKKFLLVGRHFFVKEDLFLDNGDQLYFLYDVPTGKGWNNLAQSNAIPALKAEMIRDVEFTEPIKLRAE